MQKLKLILMAITLISGAAVVAEDKTYFKSELAGSDLPFSDAVLVGDTL